MFISNTLFSNICRDKLECYIASWIQCHMKSEHNLPLNPLTEVINGSNVSQYLYSYTILASNYAQSA